MANAKAINFHSALKSLYQPRGALLSTILSEKKYALVLRCVFCSINTSLLKEAKVLIHACIIFIHLLLAKAQGTYLKLGWKERKEHAEQGQLGTTDYGHVMVVSSINHCTRSRQ